MSCNTFPESNSRRRWPHRLAFIYLINQTSRRLTTLDHNGAGPFYGKHRRPAARNRSSSSDSNFPCKFYTSFESRDKNEETRGTVERLNSRGCTFRRSQEKPNSNENRRSQLNQTKNKINLLLILIKSKLLLNE